MADIKRAASHAAIRALCTDPAGREGFWLLRFSVSLLMVPASLQQ